MRRGESGNTPSLPDQKTANTPKKASPRFGGLFYALKSPAGFYGPRAQAGPHPSAHPYDFFPKSGHERYCNLIPAGMSANPSRPVCHTVRNAIAGTVHHIGDKTESHKSVGCLTSSSRTTPLINQTFGYRECVPMARSMPFDGYSSPNILTTLDSAQSPPYFLAHR